MSHQYPSNSETSFENVMVEREMRQQAVQKQFDDTPDCQVKIIPGMRHHSFLKYGDEIIMKNETSNSTPYKFIIDLICKQSKQIEHISNDLQEIKDMIMYMPGGREFDQAKERFKGNF